MLRHHFMTVAGAGTAQRGNSWSTNSDDEPHCATVELQATPSTYKAKVKKVLRKLVWEHAVAEYSKPSVGV